MFVGKRRGIMSNPILNERFSEQERVLQGEPMTVNGTLQITAFLSILLVAAAAFVWSRFTLGYTDIATMLTGGGGIVGFILALIICFTRTKVLVPVYAVCEGLFLGGISASMEASYPGIVSQAVLGTFAALFSMLILYRANIIRCNDKFRSYTAFGLVTCIVLQTLLNCGVVCGALPSTGITLPFFSSGGSSLIVTLIMCGVIINVSKFDNNSMENYNE